MMRCMYSGVSGLKVHQTKMDVIGNNIANVNTIGFKKFVCNIFGYSLPDDKQCFRTKCSNRCSWKKCKKQIGLGSTVSAITSNITTSGGSQRTDKPFDLMIEKCFRFFL